MEDLFVCDPSDHLAIFETLRRGGPLTEKVVRALDELREASGSVHPALGGGTLGDSVLADGTLANPSPSGDTLAPPWSPNDSGTLASGPSSKAGSEVLDLAPGSGGTLAPERSSAARGLKLDPELGENETLAPERATGLTLAVEREPSGEHTVVPERPGRAVLSSDTSTLAPERSVPGGGTSTVAPERPGPVASEGTSTVTPERRGRLPAEASPSERSEPEGDATLSDESETLVGQDDLPAARSEGGGASEEFIALAQIALKSGGEKPIGRRVAELELVTQESRRRLQDSALMRLLASEGLADALALERASKAARARDVLLVEHIRQQRLVDPRALKTAQQTLRPLPVCGECLMVQPGGHQDVTPCISCGELEPSDASIKPRASSEASGVDSSPSQLIRSASQRESILTGTEVATHGTAKGSQGFQGFPGSGGQFAGYELLTRIAEGGMGVVFKARDLNLNRIVALKVMRGGALASRTSRRRFLVEAEAAAALQHPNIVRIHQISEVSGYPFYTMDYVEGQVLDEWVESRGIKPRQIADMIRRVADAVHHFHLRGIIHRDLKPDNVLVDTDAEPRVIDFGIAKKMSVELDSDISWTIEGDVLGTPHYMPPEQAAGRVDEIDTRSDVYALGAILYQLLNNGKPPYHAVNGAAKIVLAIQNDDPPPLVLSSAEDKDLEAIVAKAMEKERELRYQSALEFAQDLGRFLNYEPIVARPASLTYRTRKLIRRHPLAASLFVAASLLAFTTVAWTAAERSERDREVTQRMAEARLRPLEQRAQAFTEVLVFDPGNPLAEAEREMASLAWEREQDKARQELALERERERRASDVKVADERRQREVAEATLKEQQARQQQRLLEEAERERKKAKAELKAKSEARARALLAKARSLLARPGASKRDRFDVFSALTDGLVLVPESQGALGAELGGGKLAICLELTEIALAEDQVGLARFWMKEAAKLSASSGRKADLVKLSAAIERRSNGLVELEEARQAIDREQWRVARERLGQARQRGVRGEVLRGHLKLVLTRCRESGEAKLAKGRTLLEAGQLKEALAEARQAKAFLVSPLEPRAADELVARCAQRLRHAAQLVAWKLWRDPERRTQAIAQLRRVARLVGDQPQVAALLVREADLRARLLSERELRASAVLLPERPELEVGPLFASRCEVNNGEYKSFVDDKGYERDAFWDREALPLRAGFLDATPGSPQRGPRSWRHGSYGDEANRNRPVAGVTYWEARAYAAWLSRKTGARWRLPTEREWRVLGAFNPEQGSLQSFPWGDSFRAQLLPRLSQPLPVGSNRGDVSPLGAHDLGGNLAEWVVKGSQPALKGAAFTFGPRGAEHFANLARTARPGAVPPIEALAAIGFRLVREVSP